MKKYLALLMAGAGLTFASVGPALAADAPDLVGVWKGEGDGISAPDKWIAGEVTIEITEQRGRAFRATIQYPGGSEKEMLVGSVTPDAKNIYFAGDDGIHIASLNGNTIDTCYIEADDDDAMAACSRLEKQP